VINLRIYGTNADRAGRHSPAPAGLWLKALALPSRELVPTQTLDLFDLGNPELDWIRLAEAMGVEGARAETLEGLADLLAVSNQRQGPFLIELVIP